MIIIFIKGLSFSRFKEKITSDHFKYHTCKWPYISRRPIIDPNDCLRASILSCLNFTWKMMMIPTTISQITYFDLYIVINFRPSLKLRLFRRNRFICNRLFFNFLFYNNILFWLLFLFFPFFFSFNISFS